MIYIFFAIFHSLISKDHLNGFVKSDCPGKPSEDFFYITEDTAFTSDSKYYGCDLAPNKRTGGASCIVQVYSSVFKGIVNENINGGAIYIKFIAKTTVTGQCIINDCKFIECKGLNGGGVYYEGIKRDTLSFDLFGCTFQGNNAIESGGAINFIVVSANVSNCTFINNICNGNGLDIYFKCAEKKSGVESFDPLKIQYCVFERSLKDVVKPLFYLDWITDLTDFVFSYNNITVPNLDASQRIYLFGISLSSTKGGTFVAESNVISPSTSYVANAESEVLRKINVSISFIDSPNQPPPDVPEGCPLPPAKYEKLTDKYAPTTGVNLYGCKDYIERRIDVQQSLLYLYSCTFHNIVSDSKGGAIMLTINYDGTPEGSIVINNCTFSDCKGLEGGALFIETKESVRFLNVTESVFENNEATSIGGAIYFHSTYATFDKCTFTNNIAATHGSDLYFYVYEEEDTEYPFLVENCKFTHDKEYTAEKTASLIYLFWRPQSDFYFNKNEIRIKENSNAFLFGSNEDVTTGNLSCKNNCLIPSNRYICKEYPILYNKLKGGFSTSCDPNAPAGPSECPAPPAEDYFDLVYGMDSTLKNVTLYGCNIKTSKFVGGASCALLVYSSTFKSIGNIDSNGGAIYISITTAKTIERVSQIQNCSFTECKSKAGGAIYIKITRSDRSANVENCTFTNNQAESTGGAIFFDIVYSDVKRCIFIDNNAKTSGNDIHYQTSERTSTSNPLSIQYCRFQRSSKENSLSLIYLHMKPASDVEFSYNNITLPRSIVAERTYLFAELSEGTGGVFKAESNFIAPKTSYVVDSSSVLNDKIVNTSFFESPDQPPPEVPEGCPLPPKSYEDLSEGLERFDGINIYGCQLSIESRIDAEISLLYLYSCTFHNIVSDSKGGAIMLTINKDGAPEGSIVINNCTFGDCKGLEGGALFIETKESVRFLNVTESVFENNEATSIGGAIYFHSTYATFDKCTFTNNIAATHGSDLYFYVYEEEDTEYPFLVENCKFTHDKEYTAEKTASLIYLFWRPQSDFYFNKNEIRIKENSNAFLFGSNEDVTTGNLSCKNNCLIPSNRYICKEYPILYNKLKGGFSTSCDPNAPAGPSECPAPPAEDYFDLVYGMDSTLKNVTLYGCNIKTSKFVGGASCALLVYSSTFKSIGNIDSNGGAIYISITTAKTIERVSQIQNCSFTECKSKAGGAIYIKITRSDRSANVENCTFTNNQAESTGGAIFFDIVYSDVKRCIFIDNNAKTSGNDIHYQTSERTSTSNPLSIQYCRFQRSSKENSLSLIYLHMKPASDVEFSYNNITLPRSIVAERTYLFAELSEGTGGVFKAESNFIAPKTSYVVDSSSVLNDKIVNTSFFESPDQPPPEVPEGCPLPPKSYEDLSEGLERFDGINIYGCQLSIESRIDAEISLLYLYSCTFHNIVSDSKGGAIMLTINKDGAPEGSIVINNCTFSDCKGLEGGALFIETKESVRFLNVTESVFENNEATSIGGAIYFHSTYATFDKCTFTNNIAATHGSDLYFYVYEEEDTEYPFLVENCKFTHDKEYTAEKTASLIYLFWRPQSDFYFNKNEIRIKENSNAFLFGSNEDVTTGNLSCKNNCLIPSNRYICKENQNLEDRVIKGFSDYCDPQSDIIIKDKETCTIDDHCQNINKDSIYAHVNIILSEFNKFIHDDNGGAVHMINTGLTIIDAKFDQCESRSAGGGGIYIYNDIEIPNKIILQKLNFNECKAVFGGAIYIYSSNEVTPALIDGCNFIGNSLNEGATSDLKGGSSIYLTTAGISEIVHCKFRKNTGKGGGCRINRDLSEKPKNNEDVGLLRLLNHMNEISNSRILISDCSFEIDENSECSVFLQGSVNDMKTEIKDCSFTGNLGKNAHHIDGQSVSKKKSNLQVSSCKFSSDKSGAVNSQFLEIDTTKQVFNLMTEKVKKNSTFNVRVLAVAAEVFCIVATVAFIVKKRNEARMQAYDITLMTDENEKSN